MSCNKNTKEKHKMNFLYLSLYAFANTYIAKMEHNESSDDIQPSSNSFFVLYIINNDTTKLITPYLFIPFKNSIIYNFFNILSFFNLLAKSLILIFDDCTFIFFILKEFIILIIENNIL